MLDINKIIQDNLPASCYCSQEIEKKQIVIHHTAGSANPLNVIAGWKQAANKVCTAFVIAGAPSPTDTFKDGDIVQAFSSKAWGYHLGLEPKDFTPFNLPYEERNSSSIAIEMCNFGYLIKDGNMYKNYLGGTIPEDQVCVLDTPYRGYQYYHAYTAAQIASLKDLLLYLCDKYSISKDYNENMFDTNKDALSGKNGIWTHTSYRANGKWDCSPQPVLIDMLKSLSA